VPLETCGNRSKLKLNVGGEEMFAYILRRLGALVAKNIKTSNTHKTHKKEKKKKKRMFFQK